MGMMGEWGQKIWHFEYLIYIFFVSSQVFFKKII